jgi:predicted nucleic acid-binding Zn ribbon protein
VGFVNQAMPQPRSEPGRSRGNARAGARGGSRRSRTGTSTGTLIGSVSVLGPKPADPAVALSDCLTTLQRNWQHTGHLAALWQAWPRLAGPQLAPHCRPLRLQGGLLTVGAAPGPWLQALRYNRHQLLGALRAAGFTLRDLRFEQAEPPASAPPAGNQIQYDWQCHPSRVDVHGMAVCPQCGSPAPAGEMGRWGRCGFCRRLQLAGPAGPAQ